MSLATGLKHVQSATHASDDVSATGGAISSPVVEITGATRGEVLPRLRAKASGTLDTDVEIQYQISYWNNASETESLDAARVYVSNMLRSLSATVAIDIVSSSSSDDSSRHLRLWGKSVGGELIYEDVVLNGTITTTSILAFAEVYRAVLRRNSDGATLDAAGVITLSESGGDAIGQIPQGLTFATREISLQLAAAKGDVSALTNRRTAPSGITFAYPGALEEGLAVPGGELAAGEKIAIYWRMRLQPGMPSADLDVDMLIDGDPYP